MASYAFRLNGRAVSADSWDPGQPLLYVLRNTFSLHGVKFGCGLGQCGACTVMLDGKAVRSCQTRIDRAAGLPSRRSRDSAQWRRRIACRRRLSPSRPRSAATARAA